MKTRAYALSRLVPHPLAADARTRVYFIGWVPTDLGGVGDGPPNLTPTMGPAHPNGCRNMVTFPNVQLAQQALDELPPEFKVGMLVVDMTIEEV